MSGTTESDSHEQQLRQIASVVGITIPSNDEIIDSLLDVGQGIIDRNEDAARQQLEMFLGVVKGMKPIPGQMLIGLKFACMEVSEIMRSVMNSPGQDGDRVGVL